MIMTIGILLVFLGWFLTLGAGYNICETEGSSAAEKLVILALSWTCLIAGCVLFYHAGAGV